MFSLTNSSARLTSSGKRTPFPNPVSLCLLHIVPSHTCFSLSLTHRPFSPRSLFVSYISSLLTPVSLCLLHIVRSHPVSLCLLHIAFSHPGLSLSFTYRPFSPRTLSVSNISSFPNPISLCFLHIALSQPGLSLSLTYRPF